MIRGIFFLPEECNIFDFNEIKESIMLAQQQDDPYYLIAREVDLKFEYADSSFSIETRLCGWCHEYQQPTASGHCPGCGAGMKK
jgi:hypothetical protein